MMKLAIFSPATEEDAIDIALPGCVDDEIITDARFIAVLSPVDDDLESATAEAMFYDDLAAANLEHSYWLT